MELLIKLLIILIAASILLTCLFFGIAVLGSFGNYFSARDDLARKICEMRKEIQSHIYHIDLYKKSIAEAKETLKKAIRFNRGKLK